MNIAKSRKFSRTCVQIASLSLLIGIVSPISSAIAAVATKLVVTTSAAGATSGAAFTTQPVITVEDASSLTVTGVAGTVSVRVNLGGQTFGTTTAVINPVTGTATFSGLGISGVAGTSYTLTFSVGGLTSATQSITPTFGAATQLVLTTFANPSTTTGQPFTTQPIVKVEDAAGNVVTSDTRTVTMSVSAGASLGGTVAVAAISGVVTYSGVTFTEAAGGTTVTLTFTGTLTTSQNIKRNAGTIPGATSVAATTGTVTVGSTLTAGALSGTAGAPVTNNFLQWKRGGTAIVGATAATYVLTSSDLGSAITVTGTRTNQSGSTSGTSAPTAAVTSGPDSPTLDSITPSSAQLSVAFTAPATTGGSALTTYQYSTDGGSTWRARAAGTTASPLVITGDSPTNAVLVNGTSYNVQIRAINAIGNGLSTGTIAAKPGTPISLAALAGVTAPVTGATPVSSITATAQYTGTVTWSPVVASTFLSNTVYTATITLTPASGFTLTGVTVNFFTVSGATATNAFNSGVVTALFPVTDTTINIAAIPGVSAPVTGATPVSSITATAQYTGTVTWSPVVASTFLSNTVYTATIALTPIAGFTLTGVGANFFSVSGATASNSAGSGSVAALFPVTNTTITTANVVITAPATGATPQTTLTDNGQYSATITWSSSPVTFASVTAYTATVSITADANYTLSGVAANFFTVNGNAATSGNAINAGSFTYLFPKTNATVSFNASGGSGSMADEKHNVASALDSNTFVFAGYTFTGWNTVADGSGTTYGDGASYPFTADATLYAQWSANINNVTYNDQGGSGESGGAATYTSGSSFVLPTTPPTRVGYSFTGWFIASSGGSALGANYTPSSPFPDVTIFAHWTVNSYVITYNDQGGSGESGGAASYTSGSSFVLPTSAPVQSGYSFLGWYLASSGGSVLGANYTPLTPFGDITIYAQWSAGSNNVIYDDQGGSGQSGGATNYISGNNFILPTTPPTQAGYVFLGWFLTSSGGSVLGANYTPLTPFGNITIYAQWSANSYGVTYNDQGGSGESGGAATYTSGSSFVLPTTPPTRAGYTFIGWFVASSGGIALISPYTPLTPFGVVTIYAQWTADINNIFYNDQGGSGESGGASTYLSGTSFVLPTTPPTRVGYTFSGWYIASSGGSALGANYTPSSPFPDVTIFAQWTINSYLITVNQSSNGTIAPTTGSVNYGSTSFTYTFTPNTGYSVASITIDGTPLAGAALTSAIASGYSFINVTATHTVTASYSINLETITYQNGGGTGSAPPSPTSVNYGSTFTTPVNTFTRAGYSFAGWSDGSNSYLELSTYPVSGTVSGNVILTATWNVLPSHTVTFNSNGGSGSMGTQSNNVAAALTINAFTFAGYSFSGWSLTSGVAAITYANGASYPFAADTTLYAQWSANPTHTITYNLGGGSGTLPTQSPVSEGASFATALSTGLTKAGFSFTNWNDGTSGYAAGANYTMGTLDVTLTATWSALASHTVIFDVNGGSGSMGNEVNNVATALTTNTFTRAGYTFTGWNTIAVGGGTPYADGAIYPFNADTTLYAQWVALGSHTVTFNSNGGSGSMGTQSNNVAAALTINAFTFAGYSFSGWSLTSGVAAITYANGASYPFAADTTLYAQWSANPTHAVTFIGNGSDGGSTPPETSTASVALTPNGFTFTAHSFSNWNTLSDGSGTVYSDGGVYSFATDMTLYAQWILVGSPILHTVSFAGNGADSGSMTAQQANAAAPLSANGFIHKDFTFFGWNTLADGSGTHYNNGDIYSFGADITLFAQWKHIPILVIFIGNGSDGGSTPAQASFITAPLTPNGFTRTNYIFTHWDTAANGTGTSYNNGADYSFVMTIFLYAQWAPANHVVTFNANGGTGSIPNQVSTGSATLTAGIVTRDGFTFSGWNTAVDGSGTAYTSGSIYDFAVDLTLYAQWTAIPAHTVTYVGGAGSIGTGPAPFSVLEGRTFVVLNNTFTNPNYTFTNWSEGTSNFNPGDTHTVFTSDIVLTAQWTPIITTAAPYKTDLNSGTDSTFNVNVLGQDGLAIPVQVMVPAGTIALNGRINIVVQSSAAMNSLGQVTLNVQLLDVFDNVIPQINKALIMRFSAALGANIVATSSDGFIWRPIPLIPNGGTTIAAGDPDGYYLDDSGHVVIVTNHLTYFGFKQIQNDPVVASVSVKKLNVSATAQMRVTGGNGTAGFKFVSKTPQICTVSTRGVVKARSGGNCQLQAIKGGDIEYLDQASSVVTLKVAGPSLVASGAGTVKTIKVNLGALYANWVVLLEWAPSGTGLYQVVTRIKLDSLGAIVTKAKVPNGSVLRIQAGGKTIASFGLPGV